MPQNRPWQTPWPPMRISDVEWIIIRDSKREPAAVIRRLEWDGEVIWRVVTWSLGSKERRLVGYFRSIEAADQSVLFVPPARDHLRQYSPIRSEQEWRGRRNAPDARSG